MEHKKETQNTVRKNYWDENINSWASLYLDISHGHEKFSCNPILSWIYNRTIIHIDARTMKLRYTLTKNFLEKHANGSGTFADIGCGSGIFSIQATKLFAKVICIDSSNGSLEQTRIATRDVQTPIEYHQLDVISGAIPKSDVALLVGVLPYIADIRQVLDKILAATDCILMNYCDENNVFNGLRRLIKPLNVRNLHFHNTRDVLNVIEKNNFLVEAVHTVGTGYLLEAVRKR